MDNITHTLIGVAVARTVCALRKPPAENAGPGGARISERALLITSVLGNNFPDADFLITGVLGGGRLGYLLQHRGFTHTVVAALGFGFGAAWLGNRFGGGRAGKPERGVGFRLVAFGIFCTLLHLFADSWNDYGVHPFWPLSNHWFYGDSIFIVEPLIWCALIPYALFSGSRRAGLIWSGVLLAMLALLWRGPFVGASLALGITLFTCLSLLGQYFAHRNGSQRGWALAWGLFLAVFLSFVTGSRLAKHEVAAHLPAAGVGTEIGASPAPGNPLCWRVIARFTDPSGVFHEREGSYSFWPEVFAPSSCYYRLGSGHLADLRPFETPPQDAHFYWLGEYSSPASLLKQKSAQNCSFEAFLHYARFPFMASFENRLYAGDLRYDFQAGSSFALIQIDDAAGCPRHVPNWDPPCSF